MRAAIVWPWRPHAPRPCPNVMSTDVQSYYTNAAFDNGNYQLPCGIVARGDTWMAG